MAVARAGLYPSFTFFGGLNTRYSNAQKTIPGGYKTINIPFGVVAINGINYEVLTSYNQPIDFRRNTYFRQLANNFSQYFGFGLNLLIFDGGVTRTNLQKAKLNVENQQLLNEQEQQILRQDIYKAYTNAVAAFSQFNANKIAVEYAQKAYEFARKRFEIGLLKPIELITNQNNLFKAKINMLSAQYDYVFKIKLLEFYKGQGVALDK